MRPVKNSLDPIKQKPDTGAVPLESFGAKRHKQHLNVISDYAGLYWVMEYFFQSFAVLTGHVKLVSYFDIIVNDLASYTVQARTSMHWDDSCAGLFTKVETLTLVRRPLI